MKSQVLYSLLIMTVASSSIGVPAKNKHHPHIPALPQCGTLRHLSEYAPLVFDRHNLTVEKKDFYCLKLLKLTNAFLTLAIDAGENQLALNKTNIMAWESPELQRLFKNIEGALDCRNMQVWAQSIAQAFTTNRAAQFNYRLNKITNDYGKFLQKALVIEKAGQNQCGSQNQWQQIDSLAKVVSASFGFSKTNLAKKEQIRQQVKFLKIERAIITFMIDSYKKPITLQSPHVKTLFKNLGLSLGCSNFEGWVNHIKKAFKSPEAKKLEKRLKNWMHDYGEFFLECFIMQAK